MTIFPTSHRHGARLLRTAIVGALTVAAGAAAPRALARTAAIILDSITIRVYDSAGVTTNDRTSALKTAGTILSRADLDPIWIVCTPARNGRLQPGCDAAPASHELVVRLTYSAPTADDGNRRAFGYSLIDASTATGTLSTVFVDRVDSLASTGKTARATVLGRAIAHELGHQLLGSNDHTTRGLMRETWTAEELTRNRAEDWQFSSAQRTALHARWASWGMARRAGTREPRPAFGS
jgi:hypothetical protein